MQPIGKILFKNAIFSFFIALISIVFFKTIFTNHYLPVFWILLVGLALITAFIHIILIKLTESSISKFATRFILITGIKMIVLLTIILTYSFLYKEQAVSFLVSFLVLYLLYTSFEVYIIIPFFKKPLKQ
ncbi:MAG: hypothetical protein A2W99_14025 [Bacteroidetes bacterium GWF2_33_16]|nr:MAG: hypothetical protein A2X00_05955 [Bacteroidetes bacterium GWE2_32_14]OFY04744.1 MAG: hypothetical protein A2W99_14025 [Bacteroidetes bacterium GWF2_33_16]